MNSIEIRCPRCGKRRQIPRDELDPPRAVRMELACADCNAGDFASPTFFAADGCEVRFEDGLGDGIER